MIRQRMVYFLRSCLVFFTIACVAQAFFVQNAEARVGGSRSFGQRPMPRYQSQPRPMQQQPYSSPMPQSQNPSRGSFMRGLAGGVAGGVLGSMLFSSLGHSQGASGFAGGGGGFGLLELILLAGLGFLAFRWWKNRQLKTAFVAGTSSGLESNPVADYGSNRTGYFGQDSNFTRPTLLGPSIDEETAQDIFFKVQGAWTRRDLSSVRDILGRDIAQILESDLKDLKDKKHINRLENISIRKVDIGETWREDNLDLVQVRFTANLLDYTTDEVSGEVKQGSNTVPVKFEEDWIFSKVSAHAPWQLVGIQQV
ncbi:MAG: Tim44 domain-containing protein [Proteobacteria bacterium]|nr:Tim44 domain-containing protein [Pseudomonadota bacterium]